MAIVTVGTVTVNMTDPSLVPFPLVSLTSGNGYVFILNLNPVSQLLDFAYILPIPAVVLGGLVYEINSSIKWYPKGVRFSFVVPVYDAGGVPLDVLIALRPIEIFKGKADPPSVSATLQYEDSLIQPIAFGI